MTAFGENFLFNNYLAISDTTGIAISLSSRSRSEIGNLIRDPEHMKQEYPLDAFAPLVLTARYAIVQVPLRAGQPRFVVGGWAVPLTG